MFSGLLGLVPTLFGKQGLLLAGGLAIALALTAAFTWLHVSNTRLESELLASKVTGQLLQSANRAAERTILDLQHQTQRTDALLVAEGRARHVAEAAAKKRAAERKEAISADEYCVEWSMRPVCPAVAASHAERLRQLATAPGG